MAEDIQARGRKGGLLPDVQGGGLGHRHPVFPLLGGNPRGLPRRQDRFLPEGRGRVVGEPQENADVQAELQAESDEDAVAVLEGDAGLFVAGARGDGGMVRGRAVVRVRQHARAAAEESVQETQPERCGERSQGSTARVRFEGGVGAAVPVSERAGARLSVPAQQQERDVRRRVLQQRPVGSEDKEGGEGFLRVDRGFDSVRRVSSSQARSS